MRQLAAVRLRQALAGDVEREVEWQPSEPASANACHVPHELVVSDCVDRVAVDVLRELLGKIVGAFPALRRASGRAVNSGHGQGRRGEDRGLWVWAGVANCGQVSPAVGRCWKLQPRPRSPSLPACSWPTAPSPPPTSPTGGSSRPRGRASLAAREAHLARVAACTSSQAAELSQRPYGRDYSARPSTPRCGVAYRTGPLGPTGAHRARPRIGSTPSRPCRARPAKPARSCPTRSYRNGR